MAQKVKAEKRTTIEKKGMLNDINNSIYSLASYLAGFTHALRELSQQPATR